MDLGYSMERPYRPVPPELTGPAERIAAFLGGGGRAVVMTGPARSGKRALLDGLLVGMAGRVTRVENQSGGALSLDHVLAQMGKVAEAEGDERGLFFRTLAEQAYDDYSAVIAVEDAHTLSSFALAALARVPGLGGPNRPGMILVLSGEASLLEKLDAPGLEMLRNSRRTLQISLVGPAALPEPLVGGGAAVPGGPGQPMPLASVAVALPVAGAGGGAAASDGAVYPDVGWSSGPLGGRAVMLALVLGLMAAGGLAVSAYRRAPPQAPVEAPVEAAVDPAFVAPEVTPHGLTPPPLAAASGAVVMVPDAAPASPSVAPDSAATASSAAAQAQPAPVDAPTDQAAAPAVMPAPSVPSSAADLPPPPAPRVEAHVRQEFDAFLDRAGKDTAKLTPAARETLFLEYKKWRARTAGDARSP